MQRGKVSIHPIPLLVRATETKQLSVLRHVVPCLRNDDPGVSSRNSLFSWDWISIPLYLVIVVVPGTTWYQVFGFCFKCCRKWSYFQKKKEYSWIWLCFQYTMWKRIVVAVPNYKFWYLFSCFHPISYLQDQNTMILRPAPDNWNYNYYYYSSSTLEFLVPVPWYVCAFWFHFY